LPDGGRGLHLFVKHLVAWLGCRGLLAMAVAASVFYPRDARRLRADGSSKGIRDDFVVRSPCSTLCRRARPCRPSSAGRPAPCPFFLAVTVDAGGAVAVLREDPRSSCGQRGMESKGGTMSEAIGRRVRDLLLSLSCSCRCICTRMPCCPERRVQVRECSQCTRTVCQESGGPRSTQMVCCVYPRSTHTLPTHPC